MNHNLAPAFNAVPVSRYAQLLPGSADKSSFGLHTHSSIQRPALEQFIAAQFERVHHARVRHFMPLLLDMSRSPTEQEGIVGLKPGFCGEMFLEHYLECPTEQAVASIVEQPIDRYSLIEIGNLAVSHRGAGLLLFVVMTCALQEAGYQWMVFTATKEVEKLIRRLGYQPRFMATASAEQLGEEAADWGQYYANNPSVMVGNLIDAAAVVRSNPRLASVFDKHSHDIHRLAACLRDHRRSHKHGARD